jgi:hypothetical protein
VRGYARTRDVFSVQTRSGDGASRCLAGLSPLPLPRQIACQDFLWENGL